MSSEAMQDRVAFLDRKNKELKLELKKKDERLSEREVTVRVLRRLNGEGK